MKNGKLIISSLMTALIFALVATFTVNCTNQLDDSAISAEDDPLVQVAELSSQLSSGVDISISATGDVNNGNGGRPDGASYGNRPSGSTGGGRPEGASYGNRPSGGGQGAMGFQHYNDDPNLLVISIADRIGGRLNFGFFASIGADVIQYDENGATVEFEQTGRPAWGSWQNGDMPKIAQTVIDFGEGLNLDRGSVSLSFAGKITIDRSYLNNELSEELSFDGFSINDANIEGTKMFTRSFNTDTNEGSLSSTITNGKITFVDGTVADWVSNNSRSMSIVIEEGEDKPTSATSTSNGETILTTSDGDVLYSYSTTNPIISDMSCSSRGRKPSSGSVETIYGDNIISIDFGDGQCSSSITITINGTTITRNIRGN